MSEKAVGADNQQATSQLFEGASETTREISQTNRELAILLSMLFTDGCVSPKNKNGWRLLFCNKSKILVDLFQNCMVKVFRLPRTRFGISKLQGKYWQTVVNSKDIGNYLVSNFGTFRTLKLKNGLPTKARLPIKWLIINDCVSDFLRVAFSCDGGLSFYPTHRNGIRGGTKWLIRTLFLSCEHDQLRKDYLRLLDSVGINARDVKADGKIKIEDKINISKFHKTIGFVADVEVTNHSKFWSSYSKQKLLELMISSYNQPSKIYNLPVFSLR